ncbi:MAG TPA: aminotransferase class V-fold PLP-dependent enzyme [Phycisphaerae bacterium]|nr:aminotransferase class V-fold PLP-dependent enzyme [Phycisphaerae bacterium]HNU45080.1 aminotransferase class V-fold PLP-dependent enzyme [Phycisphaerae bacterium]
MVETQLPDRRRFLQQCAAAAAGLAGVSGCAPRGVNAWTRLAGTGGDEEELWKATRKQFVLAPGLAYFNAGGLGPSPKPVTAAWVQEAAALERVCETGHERVQAIRRKLSDFLGCAEDELAITRNSTEGMNLVARGLTLHAGDEVLLTTHEHPGGALPWLALEKESGIRVNLVEPGEGGDDTLGRIAAALTPRTRVVAVSHILCTTGMCLPARKIVQLCRERGITSVLDGAQAVGMIPVDLHELGCDFYVTSGHKWLLGPKGTGMLYIRADARALWRPTQVGAWSDVKYDLDEHVLEFRSAADVVEYGTRNTALVCGLGAAADFLNVLGMERVAGRGRALALYLRQRLHEVPAVRILTPADEGSSASVITFAAKDEAVDVRTWAQPLQERHKVRTRPVGEHGLRALRVCTHIYNTHAEIDRLVVGLAELSRTT